MGRREQVEKVTRRRWRRQNKRTRWKCCCLSKMKVIYPEALSQQIYIRIDIDSDVNPSNRFMLRILNWFFLEFSFHVLFSWHGERYRWEFIVRSLAQLPTDEFNSHTRGYPRSLHVHSIHDEEFVENRVKLRFSSVVSVSAEILKFDRSDGQEEEASVLMPNWSGHSIINSTFIHSAHPSLSLSF